MTKPEPAINEKRRALKKSPGRNKTFKRAGTGTPCQGAPARAAAAMMVASVLAGESLRDAQLRLVPALPVADRALALEIANGCLRNLRLLQAAAQALLAKQPDARVYALLLCGLYQCSFLHLPAHAAVSASVGACPLLGRSFAKGLVNAVLRRFVREGCALPRDLDPEITYSYPRWMREMLEEDYGREKAAQIMAAGNERAPMFLRVELDRISLEDYCARLDAAGFAYKTGEPRGLIELQEPVSTTQLPLFAEGLVSVQDKAAQCAAPLLELSAGLSVLDCCCAPGGKSAHILASGFEVQLTAADADPKRLYSAAQNLVRLKRLPPEVLSACSPEAGIPERYAGKNVSLRLQDGTALSPAEGLYDRILLDAPCSGSGVIRRHPDIKWLRRRADITALTELQSLILDAAFACLKPGGIMLYTTCSVFKAENERQINSFLHRQQGQAELLPFSLLGQNSGMIQRLPGQEDADGFFYARLRRIS